MRISELDRRKIAIWGYGREGRAALAALRWRLPGQKITIFCNEQEAISLREQHDEGLDVREKVTSQELAEFDYIIKSPGISPYSSPAADAALAGAKFISGTSLWFSENPGAHTVCVTGTKGKSTTTALIAHLLRQAGERTVLAGNIGMPMLELLDVQPPPDAWAIELSSFQTREAIRPNVAVVLNLFPEHLDWHGSEARYYEDKLALITQANPQIAIVNGADPRLKNLRLPGGKLLWFNTPEGWHVHDHWIMRGGRSVVDAKLLPLPGRHNWQNLCAALAAVEALGLDACELAASITSFKALPHRLQMLGQKDGIEFVNDSISTTPHATLAALDCYKSNKLALLVGGYDRGLEWGVFADRMALDPPAVVVTMGQNGPRIYDLIKPLSIGGRFVLLEAEKLEQAVRVAIDALDHKGLVMLSPGAPSFPRYTDYTERGRHFAQAAGFDPNIISKIPGLGLA